MKKSMKLWQKILIGLLAAAVLFCVYFFGVWLFSDRIVRVTYNGLENMFSCMMNILRSQDRFI